MFACFNQVYGLATGENVLVYPGNLIKKPKTICINFECSLSFLLEREMFWEELGEIGFNISEFENLDKYHKKDPRKLLLQIMVGLLLIILCYIIILPEDVIADPSNKEVVIHPQDLPAPAFIFVNEEPEYFADEISPDSPFSQVPIIASSDAMQALIESRGEKEASNMKIAFMEDVGEGLIDLKKWEYKK